MLEISVLRDCFYQKYRIALKKKDPSLQMGHDWVVLKLATHLIWLG